MGEKPVNYSAGRFSGVTLAAALARYAIPNLDLVGRAQAGLETNIAYDHTLGSMNRDRTNWSRRTPSRMRGARNERQVCSAPFLWRCGAQLFGERRPACPRRIRQRGRNRFKPESRSKQGKAKRTHLGHDTGATTPPAKARAPK